MAWFSWGYEDVLDYAKKEGNAQAHDLLLLGGPDAFSGSYTEFMELLSILETK